MPILEEPKDVSDSYSPEEGSEEQKIQKYLLKRVEVLKQTKKNILDGLDFEKVMKDADEEYQPRLLGERNKSGVMLVQDELTGLRGASKIVPIGSDTGDWRSNVSEPSLMIKMQTALAILIDRNPEATFKAMSNKFKERTILAHALWKRSWVKSKGNRTLKLFVFDLMKYGWAIGRTYPRLVRRDGEILESIDVDNPENNKYRKVRITEYNDIFREKLDPHRTWVDDMTNLTDPWSMDDWYFEKDYSRDTFLREFGDYSNADKVKFGQINLGTEDEVDANDETKKRDDMVTVGFYESKNKDLYSMWIPNQNIVLYSSPLPNDQKKLSCWWTYWIERDPRTPYGLGMFEMIKNDKVLYDRLSNMTIDQLTMAIYPMLFYSGSNKLTGSGDMVVSPGLVKQKLPGTTIEQIKVDYDPRGIESVRFMQERIDDITGITPTLIGEIQGKTLGETLHAKDAALRRLSTPLKNIAEALEDEAYIALSWTNQIFSIPEVMEFASADELANYQEESGKEGQNVNMRDDGSVQADFFQSIDLDLKEDRGGNLLENPSDRFFTIGKDIDTTELHWEGIVSIEPLSILAPSKELERQLKLELYNLVQPVIQGVVQFLMQGMVKEAADIIRPVRQVLEIQGEKPENWLPKEVIEFEKNPEEFMKKMKAEKQASEPLFVEPGMEGMQEGMPGGMEGLPQMSGAMPGEQSNPIAGRDEVKNPLREVFDRMGGTNSK